jgi:hypothetical protein
MLLVFALTTTFRPQIKSVLATLDLRVIEDEA